MNSDARLSEGHKELLRKQAVDPDRALSLGFYSANRPEDLPPDLADYTFSTPGLVYTLRHLNGDVTHQIRQDNPAVNKSGEATAKYLQPKGSGTVITVPEIMQDRVHTATTLLIVEGTKQTLAAALVCEDDKDVLVIGLQGAYGWKQNKRLHQDIDKIIDEGKIRSVEVLFDQDVATNPNVWQAANDLGKEINTSCKIPLRNITYLSIPDIAGKKAGLDDLLGKILPEDRQGVLKDIRSSGGKLPRDPKHVVNRGGNNEYLSTRMESAQTVKVTVSTNSEGEEEEYERVLMNAAAEIVEVECILDKEGVQNVSTTYVLDVAVPTPDEGVEIFHGIRVPSQKLASIDFWLSKLPGVAGTQVSRASLPQDDVANAIRENSTRFETVNIMKRVGWTLDSKDRANPSWAYALPGGSFGPAKLDTNLLGVPPQQQYADIECEDIYSMSDDVIRDAVHTLISTRDLFNEPLQWDLSLAGVALSFLPIPPRATLGFFGPRSSGKSTIAQGISCMLNTAWAPGQTPMATFNGTEAAMASLADGLSSCFLHVDDLRTGTSRRESEALLKALDSLLRRSYGSGGRIRGLYDSGTGMMGLAPQETADPLLIVTGEQVPTGGGLADSALDRLLVVNMQPNKTFKVSLNNQFEGDTSSDGGAKSLELFEVRCSSGKFQVAGNAYFAYLSRMINSAVADIPAKKLDATIKRLDAMRNIISRHVGMAYEKELSATGSTSTRAQMTIASLAMGLWAFLDFASEVGAFDKAEISGTVGRFVESVVKIVVVNTESIMGGNPDPGDMLQKIRSLVSSRSATIDPDDPRGSARLVGQRATANGRNVILLNHAEVSRLLGLGDSGRPVANALKDIVIPSTSRGKGTTRTGRIGGVSLRCLAVPLEVWDPDWEENEANLDKSADDSGIF